MEEWKATVYFKALFQHVLGVTTRKMTKIPYSPSPYLKHGPPQDSTNQAC